MDTTYVQTLTDYYQSFNTVMDTIAASPLPLLLALIVCIIIGYRVYMKIVYLVHGKISASKRDNRREFSQKQKRAYSAQCGDRCENVFWWGGRCHHRGHLAGDHWYPHARGGATSDKNLVMLCTSCNSHKSAKIPGVLWTLRITWSRKRYGLPRPGEWM